MKTAKEILGYNLKRLRKTAGLSQEALAEKAGMSWAHLQQCETGGSWPSTETIEKVSNALGVHQSALCADPDAKGPMLPVADLAPEQLANIVKMLRAGIKQELRDLAAISTKNVEQAKPVNIPSDILEALSNASEERLFRVRLALGIEPIRAEAPKASKKKA